MHTVPIPSSPRFPIFIEDERPLYCQYLKPGSNTATWNVGSGELTFLDTSVASTTPTGTSTLSSPGNLERLELYIFSFVGNDVRNGTTEGVLRFYLDGSGSPDISVNLGHMLNRYGAGADDQNCFCTDDYGCDYNNAQLVGGWRNLFYPFNTSLKATYQGSAVSGGGGNVLCFTQAFYRLGTPPTWKGGPGTRRAKLRQALLGSVAAPWTNVTGLATQNLINISGSRGELEGLSWGIQGNDGNALSLEGHVTTSIDGTLVSESGGTEDYFGGHDYWIAIKPTLRSRGCCYVGTAANFSPLQASNKGASAYRLWGRERGEQLTFGTGVQIAWTNGQASVGTPATAALASNVFYYTDH